MVKFALLQGLLIESITKRRGGMMMAESVPQSRFLRGQSCPQLAPASLGTEEEGPEEDGRDDREPVPRATAGGKGTKLWGRVQNALQRRKVNREVQGDRCQPRALEAEE